MKMINTNKKEFEREVRNTFGRYSVRRIYDGEWIYVYTALAKKNTPTRKIAMSSPYWRDKRKDKRVHVATWIPSKKNGYMFLESYMYLKNPPKSR